MEKNFCVRCGNLVSISSMYCGYCGRKLNNYRELQKEEIIAKRTISILYFLTKNKKISTLILLLLICCVIFIYKFYNAPEYIALNTRNFQKGITAIERINDQKSLVKIIITRCNSTNNYYFNFDLCKAALNKISDQELLKTIVFESEDLSNFVTDCSKGHSCFNYVCPFDTNNSIGLIAINKISNQNLLLEIIKKKNNTLLGFESVKKISDINLLSKIAVDNFSDSSMVDIAAINKLIEFNLLNNISMNTVDRNFHLIFKYINALKEVPQFNKNRLAMLFLPIIQILNNPKIIKELGEITSINLNWDEIYETYYFGNVYGEIYSFSIKLKYVNNPLIIKSKTIFPSSLSEKFFEGERFLPAETNAFDMLLPIKESLPKNIILN